MYICTLVYPCVPHLWDNVGYLYIIKQSQFVKNSSSESSSCTTSKLCLLCSVSQCTQAYVSFDPAHESVVGSSPTQGSSYIYFPPTLLHYHNVLHVSNTRIIYVYVDHTRNSACILYSTGEGTICSCSNTSCIHRYTHSLLHPLAAHYEYFEFFCYSAGSQYYSESIFTPKGNTS